LSDDDIIFLHSLRQQNTAAYDRLYAEFYRPLCYFAQGQVEDPSSAEDMVTENFHNSSWYLIRYGFLLNKPALLVTSTDQAAYIMDKRFDERNLKELKYLPYRDKRILTPNEIEFYPVLSSLHRDPTDPLDP
jgi:hypothetical protein